MIFSKWQRVYSEKFDFHGIFMKFLWDFYGISMGFLWESYGIFMGILWD